MVTKAKELIKLGKDFAKEKGFELSKTEKKLLTSVAEGKEADYSATDEAENDPKQGETWDKSRSPNVDIIIWLCTDKEAISYLTHRGIIITGAKIEGCLDLDFIDIDIPLIFRRCYFTEGIRLQCARVKLLNFSGSYIISSSHNAIFAQCAEIKGYVFLNNGFHAKGQVSFAGATIRSNFQCDKGIFENPNPNILNPNKFAIFAENAEIKGYVFLNEGFHAKGGVSFLGATIGRNFQCDKGIFENCKAGDALIADNAEIKGSVFLDKGFQATGTVSFYGATIGGNFRCENALFKNSQGDAISLQNSDIQGSVFLNNNFQANGKVNLIKAIIRKNLVLSNVKNTQQMILDLTFTTIETLADKEDSWPEKDKLYLDGLMYSSISSDTKSPVDSQSRLKWIRLQNLKENFSPQPYEQLAKVLRMSGHEETATDILIAKQNDRRKYSNFGWLRNLWFRILNKTIAHGYRTQKIFVFVFLFIIIGWGIFYWGESQNLMSPSRIIALVDSSSTEKIIDPNYPKFNAFMYSVDTFFPIIDFYQESYWLPNANIKGDVEIPLNYSNIIYYKNACIGSLLRFYFWFHIFMGWVFTSLGVAGFTGLVRRLE